MRENIILCFSMNNLTPFLTHINIYLAFFFFCGGEGEWGIMF